MEWKAYWVPICQSSHALEKKPWVLISGQIQEGWHLYAPPEKLTSPFQMPACPHLVVEEKTVLPTQWSQARLLTETSEKKWGYEHEVWFAIPGDQVSSMNSNSIQIRFVVCGQSCRSESLSIPIHRVSSLSDQDWLCRTFHKLTPTGKIQTAWLLLPKWILLAFIGGIFLNGMPCVLPVLCLKMISLSSVKTAQSAWRTSLGYALGILASFFSLGTILVVFRSIGQELGWGFQLQSPGFVSFLIGVFFLMALNLFGVFEVGLRLQKLATHEDPHPEPSWLSSFGNGILTTLIATPCTAPFIGTTLALALSQPPWVAYLTLLSLGTGMALPYVLFSNVPFFKRFLPKPGKWMVRFKQLLGFGLLGTVIWLLRVLSAQVSQDFLFLSVWGLFCLSLGAWLLGQWGNLLNPGKSRYFARVIAFILIGGGLSAGTGIFPASQSVKLITMTPYSPEILKQFQEKGQKILLLFSAKWCLTCEVQNRLLFENDEIVKLLKEKSVQVIRADLTNRDPHVLNILQSYGRTGIPFYVLLDGFRVTNQVDYLSKQNIRDWLK